MHRRLILAPTPRERERWHAIWLLAQGWTASAIAEALEGDSHTIGRWAAAFGEGGPRFHEGRLGGSDFRAVRGSPPPRLPSWIHSLRLGISWNGLARQCGLSSGYFSLLMAGKRSPSPEARRRIQEALGVNDFARLFFIEPYDEDSPAPEHPPP